MSHIHGQDVDPDLLTVALHKVCVCVCVCVCVLACCEEAPAISVCE